MLKNTIITLVLLLCVWGCQDRYEPAPVGPYPTAPTDPIASWTKDYYYDANRYRVTIYDYQLDRKFTLDSFTTILGLGTASHWRRDGEAVAFTTVARREGSPAVSELVVLDAAGQVLLCSQQMPELVGLEFISYSPDGRRIAALRPTEAECGGRTGGVVVVVDPEQRTAKPAAEISLRLAGKHLGRFQELLRWDAEGQCSVGVE